MNIYPMKLPTLTKAGHAKPGQLITPYDDSLNKLPSVIICEYSDTHPWHSWPEKLQVFDPVSGNTKTIHPSTKCEIHKNAAIVIDYIEGK
jgi:hypothetical protein